MMVELRYQFDIEKNLRMGNSPCQEFLSERLICMNCNSRLDRQPRLLIVLVTQITS